MSSGSNRNNIAFNSNQVNIQDLPLEPRPIKILLDARKLGDGGIGTYIDNLIFGLLDREDIDLSVILRSGQALNVLSKRKAHIIYDLAPLYSLDELWGISKRIDTSKFDLYHAPHFTLPFNIAIPTIVTIHDLIHIRHPERFFYPWVARPLIKSALKRATGIVTVSKSTLDDLEVLVNNNSEILNKITIIPNAINLMLNNLNEDYKKTLARLGIPNNYLLSVFSNVKPHKALPDLIKALALIDTSDLSFVLVGKGISKDEVVGLCSKYSLKMNITVLGEVSTEELAALYAGAKSLIVPSRYEGFCLPILEAKSFGKKVVVRPVSALQELVDERDIVCIDNSIESLAAGIRQAWSGITDINESDRSEDLFLRYNVTRVTDRMVDVYKSVLDWI